VIKDVRLLATNAAPRPASVNDDVRQGTAVRTGADSRAELTFSDLTITRIGQNTVFSFKGGSREVTLDSGAILLQVPKGAEAAKIRTAAVTASITGGTALMNANSGYPTKLYIMEGAGELCVNSGECVTAHGGQMVMEDNGQLTRPVKFNAKLMFKTSPLLTGFPALPNEGLMLEVIDEQGGGGPDVGSTPPPALPTPPPTMPTPAPTPAPTVPPSGKFGPLTTISSPDPYVISNGTQINTDPMITTNGVTDQGKLYRGTAVDGFPTQYLFGEAPTTFDQMVFAGSQNNLPIAIFKFAHLQLAGDPTVTIPSGATTFLALVSVGDITSGGPGGTLTFAGITRLSMITQAGSITLGPEISFSGIDHLEFYARGSGSNLTLASPISGGAVVKLYSEGTVQVNGDITASSDFNSLSGGDYLSGTGTITAFNIDIESLSNINIDGSKFPNPPGGGGSVIFNAADTLNLAINGGGVFGWDTLSAQANTINITSPGPTTFDFSNSSSVTFTAGAGGINAPNIDFLGGGLSLLSGGSINVRSVLGGAQGADATISAATSFTASGDVNTSILTAGTTVTVGGGLFVNDTLTAGGNINIGGFANVLNINAPSGVLTVQGGIFPNTEVDIGSALQHTFNVDSIVSPQGIHFGGNQFQGFAGLFAGGRLTINANTLTFDSTTGIAFANFDGADAGAFGSGNPAEGGDGGVFIVNTTGNITANNGADIMATTGLNTAAGVYSGAGGSVTLHSTGGMVTVNDTIQVSSDDSPAQRQSASGGTILLQSDLTTGPGITVGANGQLLSLLNTNAPGPGGSITLSTMGADITVNGTIEADRGTITIDQKDPAGTIPTITIDGATLTSDTVNIEGAGAINIGLNNPVTINSNELELQILNELDAGVPATSGGTIAGDSKINVSESALSTGGLRVYLLNENDQGGTGTAGGHIDGSASITMNINGALDVNGTPSNSDFEPGAAQLFIDNYGFGDGSYGGFIGSDASVSIAAASISSAGDFAVGIANDDGGTIGGAARLSVTAGSMSVDEFSAQIINGNFTGGAGSLGGQIAGAASITFNITGALTVAGGTDNDGDEPSTMSFVIDNSGLGDGSPAGSIGSDASIGITAGSISDDGRSLRVEIFNSGGGEIGGNASITVTTTGSISAAGPGPTGAGENLNLLIDNSAAGNINGSATIGLNAGSVSTAGSFNATIDSSSGGTIFGQAMVEIGTTGNITANSLIAAIYNSNGGTIDSTAFVTVNLGQDLTTTNLTPTLHDIDVLLENQGGTIGTDAGVGLQARDISSAGAIVEVLENNGGTIDGGAAVNLGARNVSTGTTDLSIGVYNPSGSIGGPASVTFVASGDVNATGNSFFVIANNLTGVGAPSASITGDATVTVSAANFSTTGQLYVAADNTAGSIGGDVALGFSATGNINDSVAFFRLLNSNDGSGSPNGMIEGAATMDISSGGTFTSGYTEFSIFNGGGLIGSDAIITLNLNNLSADTLVAQIDNSNGGSIGGDATINMNVSGTATVTNDATVQILGSDGAASAAINFNGGSYAVGGTFLSTIDGDGAITFTNASVHADIVKAGVFGTNGTLTVGGGTLSADTVLKLYAPGSNGTIDFNASVTLSSGTAMHLAANTITIEPGFTVTIAGAGGAANIYTEHPNYNFTPGGGYTGPPGTPGNGSFGGNGALDPVPLASAPGFGAPPVISSSSISNPGSPLAATSGTPLDGAINISSTGQLLALLDTAVTGPGGKVTIPGPNSGRNSGRPGRIYAESDLEVDRGARQTTSSATGKLNYAGANNPQPLNHAPPGGPPGI
jgi:hypothetical protein